MGFLGGLFESWRRKREERERDFLAANAWASAAPQQRKAAATARRPPTIDREGLQAAFLDQSGQIAYYLDVDTGDVIDDREPGVAPEQRYRRVPARSAEADAAERSAFLETLEACAMRDRLEAATDAAAFRSVLAEDRTFERAWYVFRNDRASAEVEKWLREMGF